MVIYESMFGDNQQVARAIATGLAQANGRDGCGLGKLALAYYRHGAQLWAGVSRLSVDGDVGDGVELPQGSEKDQGAEVEEALMHSLADLLERPAIEVRGLRRGDARSAQGATDAR